MKETELPTNFSIRLLQVEDINLIQEFDQLATYEQNITPSDHQPPQYTSEELKAGIDKSEIRGIFNEQDQIVAYYWLEDMPDSLYIGGIAVHPGYRNRGIAQFIMQQAELTAKEHQKAVCTLTVDPYNGRGIHVYFKAGYVITGYEPDAFKLKGCARFHMEKPLLYKMKMPAVEEKRICVNDIHASEIIQALQEGYIGTALIRSEEGDKENIIVYTK